MTLSEMNHVAFVAAGAAEDAFEAMRDLDPEDIPPHARDAMSDALRAMTRAIEEAVEQISSLY